MANKVEHCTIRVTKAKEIISNLHGSIPPKQSLFFDYLFGIIKIETISADDFAEQLKRAACNLKYGSVNKTGELITHELARDPVFEKLGNFCAELRETVLLAFPKQFAKRVVTLIPERVRNQLEKERVFASK